ncbi:MAG TPA: RNA-binding protein [Rhizobiaceae bacterium]|nr:RNA-binding protein [Rhizobiaceae bacterium]
MNERTCIVTRTAREAEEMIRFVAAPGGAVVPDLKRNLPGRGCWVSAERSLVDKAVARKLFARALKADVSVPDDLGGMVDDLLVRAALGAAGLARKAGAIVLGAAKVEAAVRGGEALLVLHAREAADDGIRKIAQAARSRARGAAAVPSYKLFSEAELGLALGGANVIHAAVLAGGLGKTVLKRVAALDRYRGGCGGDALVVAELAGRNGAAEDVE